MVHGPDNMPHDFGLSVTQNQGEEQKAGPTKIGQATRSGEVESSEGGKTFASYSVKMKMPDGGERSFKVRVGFNDAQLREHVKGTAAEGTDLVGVIDKIVDNMDASSIIKLSGHQVSTRLNDLDNATVTLKGGEKKTLGELAEDPSAERQSVGSSAEKVIKSFAKSSIGQIMGHSQGGASSVKSSEGGLSSTDSQPEISEKPLTDLPDIEGESIDSNHDSTDIPSKTSSQPNVEGGKRESRARSASDPSKRQSVESERERSYSEPPIAEKRGTSADTELGEAHILEDGSGHVAEDETTPSSKLSGGEQSKKPERFFEKGFQAPLRSNPPLSKGESTVKSPEKSLPEGSIESAQSEIKAVKEVVTTISEGGEDPLDLSDIGIQFVVTEETKPPEIPPATLPRRDPSPKLQEALQAVSNPKFKVKNHSDIRQMTEIFSEVVRTAATNEKINLNGTPQDPHQALSELLNSNKAFQTALQKELRKDPPNESLKQTIQMAVAQAGYAIKKDAPQLSKFIIEQSSDPQNLQNLGKLLQLMPDVKSHLSLKRAPATSISTAESQNHIATAQSLAIQIEGHIKSAEDPGISQKELMLAFQKMNQVRVLSKNTSATSSFDQIVKPDQLEKRLNEAILAQAQLTKKESKQVKKLTIGKWKQINPSKVANLMRKELLVAVTDLGSIDKTPLMDELKSQYPVEFAQALAENPDVALLTAEREKLSEEFGAVLAANVPIRDYAKHFRANQETQALIKEGKIATTWEAAQAKGMDNTFFEAQLKGIETKKQTVEDDKAKAQKTREKLETIVKENPGSPIAEAAGKQLEMIKNFIAGDDQVKCEMSDLQNMTDKTPLNVMAGINSNIGTAFPPGKVSFTLKEIESGQMKMTLRYLKQSDPSNGDKYDTLISTFNDLEDALTEHASTFRKAGSIISEDEKLRVNPDLEDTPELREAITDLQAKLNNVEKQLLAIDFPDLPPVSEQNDKTVSYLHAGNTAVAFLLPQCASTGTNQKFLNQMKSQLGMT